MEKTLEVFGAGRYLKKCAGCKKPFRTDGRNARYGPPELCSCLERRAKHRAKRRRERRLYHKNPDKYRALSRTRAASRKKLLEFCRANGIVPECNQCGKHKNELKKLHAHHRDHNPFNLHLEVYPQRSNIEWLCRKCHEHSDRAKVGLAALVPYKPPPQMSFVEHLVMLRGTEPRRFFLVPVSKLYDDWCNTL